MIYYSEKVTIQAKILWPTKHSEKTRKEKNSNAFILLVRVAAISKDSEIHSKEYSMCFFVSFSCVSWAD
jgi:hypothetical protein